MNIIEIKNLSYSYDGASKRALDDISLTVKQGEFVAIVGRNGCGKSTLARHINALFPVQSGSVTVSGMSTGDEAVLWDIRKCCGMVFQNPDNQFVSSLVSEDIAFALENYDYPENQINKRVGEVLDLVGLAGFEKRSPHMLSGGQKQRLAIAGVLAINPDIMIFDEATAMLDPTGREDVLGIIKSLHSLQKKTIVMITHSIYEAALADRIAIMDEGRIVAIGTPDELLTDTTLLKGAGLEIPISVRLYNDLRSKGITLPACPITIEGLVDML